MARRYPPTSGGSPSDCFVPHFLQSFDLCDEDPAHLVVLCAAIFEVTGCVALCRLPPVKLRNFLLAARKGYRTAEVTPYHGWFHGVHVLLNAYRLLRSAAPTIVLTPLEMTALVRPYLFIFLFIHFYFFLL